MNGEQIKKMEARLAVLEAYVAERKKQQLTVPLDNGSRQIINGSLLEQTGAFFPTTTIVDSGYLPITVNGVNHKLMVTNG